MLTSPLPTKNSSSDMRLSSIISLTGINEGYIQAKSDNLESYYCIKKLRITHTFYEEPILIRTSSIFHYK